MDNRGAGQFGEEDLDGRGRCDERTGMDGINLDEELHNERERREDAEKNLEALQKEFTALRRGSKECIHKLKVFVRYLSVVQWKTQHECHPPHGNTQ